MISLLVSLLRDQNSSPQKRLQFWGLLFSGALSIYLGFFHFSAPNSVVVVRDYGYFAMLVVFLLWAFQAYRVLSAYWGDCLNWCKEFLDWKFYVTFAALTLTLWFTQEVGFKVLMDEIILLSTSMSMHIDRQAVAVLRAYELSGAFVPIEGFVDKRPLMYPFLVTMLHDFTGYRPENPFVINMACLPVGLFLSFVLGVILSGKRAGGYLAMIFLALFPLYNQCCHGGGFEALNLVMIFGVFLTGYFYLQNPRAEFLSLLCLTSVFLANVRYESALFIIPTGLLIIAGWLRKKEMVISYGLILTPLLLLPIPLLFRVFEVAPDMNWQLSSKGAESPFGFEYFARNLGQAYAMFFDRTQELPVSLFLSWFGFLGFAFFVATLFSQLRKKRALEPAVLSLIFVLVGIGILLALLLLYFWDFNSIMTRRLALPMVILMMFPPIYAIAHVKYSDRVFAAAIGLALIAMVLDTTPRNSKELFTLDYDPGEMTKWQRQFIKDNPNEYNLMIDIPGLWITHHWPAITTQKAQEKKGILKYHLENKTFDNIYVVQKFTKDIGTRQIKPRKNSLLDEDFILETVAETTVNGYLLLRISRVVDIDREVPSWIERQLGPVEIEQNSIDDKLSEAKEQQRRLAWLLP
ncbi:MAG: hypothetical protein AAFX93_17820 [Verrucomicrobiota bacterium]